MYNVRKTVKMINDGELSYSDLRIVPGTLIKIVSVVLMAVMAFIFAGAAADTEPAKSETEISYYVTSGWCSVEDGQTCVTDRTGRCWKVCVLDASKGKYVHVQVCDNGTPDNTADDYCVRSW